MYNISGLNQLNFIINIVIIFVLEYFVSDASDSDLQAVIRHNIHNNPFDLF